MVLSGHFYRQSLESEPNRGRSLPVDLTSASLRDRRWSNGMRWPDSAHLRRLLWGLCQAIGGAIMRLIIEARMEYEQTSSTATAAATIVAVVERQDRSIADLGLTLGQSRALLAKV